MKWLKFAAEMLCLLLACLLLGYAVLFALMYAMGVGR